MRDYLPQYECADCEKVCVHTETGICRWGQVRTYECPEHGRFQVMDAPMKLRGLQIR